MSIESFLESVKQSMYGTKQMNLVELDAVMQGRIEFMTTFLEWLEEDNRGLKEAYAFLEKEKDSLEKILSRKLRPVVDCNNVITDLKTPSSVNRRLLCAWIRGELSSLKNIRRKLLKARAPGRDDLLETVQKELTEEINFLGFQLGDDTRIDIDYFREKYVGNEDKYFLTDKYFIQALGSRDNSL